MEIIRFDNSYSANFLPNLVVTIGMFDGVHIGHKAIIEKLILEAKRIGATPVVITFDQHPRLVLNQDAESLELLCSQEEKFNLLKSLGVEQIFIIPFTKEFAKLSTMEFVKQYLVDRLHIKGLILGYDNHFGSKKTNDFECVFELSEQYHFFTKTVEACIYNGITVSSTQIRKMLKGGNTSLANSMLGYKYTIEGKVISGEKIGRTLNFPTANLQAVEKYKLLPQQGVYAVYVKCQEETLKKGMLSIGTRPTFGVHQLSVEVHIFDFSKDIYGQNITLLFEDKIRDEKKFSSIDKLKKQLELDKAEALKRLYI